MLVHGLYVRMDIQKRNWDGGKKWVLKSALLGENSHCRIWSHVIHFHNYHHIKSAGRNFQYTNLSIQTTFSLSYLSLNFFENHSLHNATNPITRIANHPNLCNPLHQLIRLPKPCPQRNQHRRPSLEADIRWCRRILGRKGSWIPG